MYVSMHVHGPGRATVRWFAGWRVAGLQERLICGLWLMWIVHWNEAIAPTITQKDVE